MRNRTGSHWTACAAALLLAGALAVPVGAADSPTTGDVGARRTDDTGRNVRDRNGRTMTPQKQSNQKSDVAVTRRIRQAIVKDDSLSTNAHNVKIITSHGVVTLRGPVATPDEKAAVAAKAQDVAGVKRVDNQLEVSTR